MDDTGDSMDRFKDAMQRVYGPFDVLTPDEAQAWTPPSNPGAGGHRGRYLWTDAFGVVNFITLYKETSTKPVYLELAKSLVRTVHDVLGRTRDGRSRLPRATDEQPLKGGLRIGKMEESGGDGDGQYHHYLTLWMFALNRLALAAGEPEYNDLAVQLGEAVHPHFLRRHPLNRHKMVWKVSMDLETVLVGSEGHLDAATGYAVYHLVQCTARHFDPSSPALGREVKDFIDLQMNRNEGRFVSASSDPLDLGMGLWMCQLVKGEGWTRELAEESLEAARALLDPNYGIVRKPASSRLAFRELGLCLGVECCEEADETLGGEVGKIVTFWQVHADTRDPDYGDKDLRPISLVMYAAALVPGGESFPTPNGHFLALLFF
ncbi:hypothetical protein IMZ48_31200 [Candidatus Bathyarchaeota archaeon]|nr:hypothetical protein [Candidatus Bathyarchaeota archaeon]